MSRYFNSVPAANGGYSYNILKCTNRYKHKNVCENYCVYIVIFLHAVQILFTVGVSGQTVSSASTSLIKPSQPQPMLAKMVTNAQGQPVISMESLLAHQKQHGSLPQGIFN